MNAPACLGPIATPTTPSWRPPPGCWDTIFHVLGPQERYPYAPQRKYTPPTATLDQYFAMLKVLGIENGIVTHANTQGPDNTIYLDAVAQAPERLFAVVKAGADLTLEEAQRWHQQGVRGARFAFHGMSGATLDHEAFEHVTRLLPELGWFLQLHLDDGVLPDWLSRLEQLPVPVVLDHFARIDPAQGLDGAGTRALLKAAQFYNVWVRLSGFERVSRQAYPYHDLAPIVQALHESAADRLLWGTDWPHTGHFDPHRMPDDGLLLEALVQCLPDEAACVQVLRTNPRRLLGLPPWQA